MTEQFAQTDVAIVGGGMAGLTVACYLAKAGVTVTLFEKSSNLGGRAATQEYEGYRFNRGIHALYSGGALEQVLRELAIPYNGHSPQGVFLLRQGKLYTAPYNPLTLIRTNLLSVADKLELMGLFVRLPRLKARELGKMSIQEWLEQNIRRPLVRQFMAAFARTYVYSAALDLVSAEVFIDKMQITFKHPVYYIDEGWQTLVDGLRKKAEHAGARIVSSARVEGITYHDGHAAGVRLRDGNIVNARAVVIATAPRDAAKLIDEDAFPALRRIVNTLIPAQIACLDVALSHLPDPRHPAVQDLERPRFLSAQSSFAHIAPAGGALIHAFKQLDPTHPTDPREDERDLEDLLDTVQPGWREALVKRFYLPRIDGVGMLPTSKGDGYAGRPGPQVAALPNLFLAGDWIGEGFLADASMGSARQVAHLLLQNGQHLVKEKAAVGSIV